jgi:long-chain acyl-CoA synthetase
VQARILGADAVKRFAYRLFMPVGHQVADLRHRRQTPGILLKMLYYLADVFLFRSIKRSLGLSNARICYTTGAMLSPEAFRFYHALNLPLRSLYGTTEGGALTCINDDEIPPDEADAASRTTEVKIDENGELIYRQPGIFVGYYRDPGMTDAVLDDGWFHSGDSALIREDGQLIFIDRAGSLVKLRCGETLAPQSIESRLRFSPYIKDAWVLAGPEGDYVSAVIVINYENVSRWAGQNRVGFTSLAELCQTPEVYELVGKDIDRVNQALPPGAKIMKYVNLDREFDPDKGELTRTRILRRDVLENRYSKLTAAIYSADDVVRLEILDAERDGKSGSSDTSLRIQSVEGAD